MFGQLAIKNRLPMVAILGGILSTNPGFAGTIRNDRSDRLYTGLADNAAWQAVGRVDGVGGSLCSATLIAPQWALCAAHCVVTTSGGVIPQQAFVVGGKRYDVDAANIFIHPRWVLTGLDVLAGEGDIALFRLPEPVLHVRPMVPYRGRDEIGQPCISVGYGSAGTGTDGQNPFTAGQRRAGHNMIDAAATILNWPNCGPVPVGNDGMLLYDFDSPSRSYSTLGSPNPMQLEYTTAQGDSGGPLLVFQGGRFLVVGICSGGMGPCGKNIATYGDTATFVRVSSYTDWMASVMSGNEPSLATMLSTGVQTQNALNRARLIAQERAAFRERLGWRQTAFLVQPGLSIWQQEAIAARLWPRIYSDFDGCFGFSRTNSLTAP